MKNMILKGIFKLIVFFYIKKTDMLETDCTSDPNLLYKDEILFKYATSDYKYKNELYQELIEINEYV